MDRRALRHLRRSQRVVLAPEQSEDIMRRALNEARAFALWPAGAANLDRVVQLIDEALRQSVLPR